MCSLAIAYTPWANYLGSLARFHFNAWRCSQLGSQGDKERYTREKGKILEQDEPGT